MKGNKTKVMKVTQDESFHTGNYYACSFEDFSLVIVREDLNPFIDMFGNEKFTDIYFRTISGNIYRIFQRDVDFKRFHNWIIASSHDPELIYTFTDEDMFLGRIKIRERFSFGNNLSAEVTEIVCVNRNITRLNISNEPEALIVNHYDDLMKGKCYH